MEKNNFKVDDRVAVSINHQGDFSKTFVYDPNHSLVHGKVLAVLPDNKLVIDWDEKHYNKSKRDPITGSYSYEPRIMNSNGILHIEEAEAKFSILEKEYNVIESEIKDKLAEAAKLLIEADKLADKAGAGSLSEMYDAISPLYRAMDQCGWNTSSFSC